MEPKSVNAVNRLWLLAMEKLRPTLAVQVVCILLSLVPIKIHPAKLMFKSFVVCKIILGAGLCQLETSLYLLRHAGQRPCFISCHKLHPLVPCRPGHNFRVGQYQ